MSKLRAFIPKPHEILAILEGQQIQFSRPIRPQPHHVEGGVPFVDPPPFAMRDGAQAGTASMPPKYGKHGDKLWIKEAWRIGCWNEHTGCVAIDYKADNYARREWLVVPNADKLVEREDATFQDLWIECCDELSDKGIEPGADGLYSWEPGASPLRWRPASQMPRWASRLTLEVLGNRVIRVQDISDDEALAHGVDRTNTSIGGYSKERFKRMYVAAHGVESWDANDWILRVAFKVEAQIAVVS